MEQLLRELRQCFRGLIRSPGFSLVVLLIISLGVGVNLIVFSALDSVALESLPYAEEDDLVVLKAKREGFPEEAITSAEYLYFRRYSQSFEMIGLIWDLRLTLTDGDRAEQVSAATVTSEVFQLLGVAAKTGRVFGREDFVGDESLAVISDELWRSRYSAAVEKVGSTIEINGTRYCPRQADLCVHPRKHIFWSLRKPSPQNGWSLSGSSSSTSIPVFP